MRLRPYQHFVEPLLALLLRRRRLAAFDALTDRPPITVDWLRGAECGSPCPMPRRPVPRLVRRYAKAGRGWRERIGLMPMAIDLSRFADAAGFDALLKQRSSRTLPKIRKAERGGYRARQFLLRNHVHDIHAVKTSMRMRSGGPVLDHWLLKPEQIAIPAETYLPHGAPTCPMHWIIWWGVFLPEPGHRQGMVETGERLVAFVKVWRMGDIVHYTEIMGHRDHLDAGVMPLLHRAIVRWLIEGDEPAARGARIVLYGGLEHGRAGLLTWKKRAGFAPVRLAAAA